MNLLHLLLRTSPTAMAIAVVAGGLSGVGSARLVALVNEVVTGRQGVTAPFLWSFFDLLAGVVVAGYVSQIRLIRLVRRLVLLIIFINKAIQHQVYYESPSPAAANIPHSYGYCCRGWGAEWRR
jgi:ABC-type siderophore export system fused ATPase/permease subunit